MTDFKRIAQPTVSDSGNLTMRVDMTNNGEGNGKFNDPEDMSICYHDVLGGSYAITKGDQKYSDRGIAGNCASRSDRELTENMLKAVKSMTTHGIDLYWANKAGNVEAAATKTRLIHEIAKSLQGLAR